MSYKYSCINLGIKFPINHIIGLILWGIIVKQYRTVIKFSHLGFFSVAVNLDLFGIGLDGFSEPCFCYP